MTYPLTPEGLLKIKQEAQHLKSVKRPEVIRAISEARAHGDLKENAEYHSAKDDQAIIEARIGQLDTMINLCSVIDIKDFKNDGRVIFGSTITINNNNTNQDITMRIVGEVEADFSKGTVSSLAPLIQACIGHFAGETIEFFLGDQMILYDIKAVEYI